MIQYDMLRCDVMWYDMIYDKIWYDIKYYSYIWIYMSTADDKCPDI